MSSWVLFAKKYYLYNFLALCFSILLFSSQRVAAQQRVSPTTSPSLPAFLSEVALKYPALVTLSSVTLNATAKWTVGSQKESGTAVLVAQSDGSSSLQLTLDTASRTEARTALGDNRACQWTDSKGTHQLNGVDCNASLAWFAPMLSIQPTATVLQLLTISDNGQVTRDSGTFREINYQTPLSGSTSQETTLLTTGTQMNVLYDSQALLPNSIEYAQHADADLKTTFPVRIVYSNYQTVSGVPIPYQIDRYVNNVLQLSLTVTNVTLQ